MASRRRRGRADRRRLPTALLAVVVGSLLAAACGRDQGGVDLLRAPDAFLDGTVAGRPWRPSEGTGALLKLRDVGYRTLPAPPPSRLRFRVTLPRRATLHFACGIAPSDSVGGDVEFVVAVRDEKASEATTVWTKRLRSRARARRARWVPGDVNLDRFGGRTVELVLETRGAAAGNDAPAAAWGAPAVSAPGAEAPLVVLYVVDTLRADHTGPYGYGRPTTPALDALAHDGVVFEHAIVSAPWTKPSMASIMTSLLPAQHGAVRRPDRLSERHVTLAESLSAAGWATGAVVANVILYARAGGFDQGFDYFAGVRDANGRRSRQVRAARVVDRALEWIDARRGRPTFVYVHTMDPHFPYAAPAPFDEMFSAVSPDDDPETSSATGAKITSEAREQMARYDGEVAYGDHEFGRFLRELRSRGLYERSLIVFSADHGEEFGDHGGLGHGHSLFDELVRVPLVVKLGQGLHAGERVALQVQGVDLMPTILEAAGVPAPPGVVGRPLQRVLSGEAREVPALLSTQHWSDTAAGVRTETEKYVRRFSPGEAELYFELTTDRKEHVNRSSANPERVLFLRDQVDSILRPSRYRYVVRASGKGGYALSLTTTGWLEQVEAAGLGSGDHRRLESGGRRLVLDLDAPSAGRREVSFVVRPMGAPVSLEGTRDGRPLRPRDVTVAPGRQPDAFPFLLPRPETQSPLDAVRRLFDPPATDASGLVIWLVESDPDELDLDEDTLEALKVLGYANP